MVIGTRQMGVALLAGMAVLGMVQPASAQFRMLPSATGGFNGSPFGNTFGSYNPYFNQGYYPNGGFGYGYFNPYQWGANPYGGYLNGAANLVSSQGQYLINSQQAYLMKEQVRAAQLQNRQRTFDEYLYEKSLRPTLNDQRLLEQQQELRRALTNPPETEIWSGKSLNDLNAQLQHMRNKGVEFQDVPLSEAMLRQINLTTKQVGNVGLLKDAGRLNWPLGLQILKPEEQSRNLRQNVDSLLLEGRRQAASNGRVDAGVVVNLEKDVEQLRTMLTVSVSDYSFSDYTGAKNYLRQVDQAIKILKLPDASNYFNGKYQPKGNSVAELLQYMTENGLRFAPAIAGEESAYSGLFAAMLQYGVGSGSMMPQSKSSSRDFYRGLYDRTQTAQRQQYQNGNMSPYQSTTPPLPPNAPVPPN